MSNIFAQLRSINPDEVVEAIRQAEQMRDERTIPLLLNIVKETSNHAIRDTAALALREFGDERAVEALVTAIQDERTSNHRSTLVWACEAFDCTGYLPLFVDLVIHDPYGAALEAHGVIVEMQGSHSPELINEMTCKLKAAMENERNRNVDNDEIILDTIDYIQGKLDC